MFHVICLKNIFLLTENWDYSVPFVLNIYTIKNCVLKGAWYCSSASNFCFPFCPFSLSPSRYLTMETIFHLLAEFAGLFQMLVSDFFAQVSD